MARWVLGSAVCLVVGVMMLAKYFTGVPPLEKLTKVEGVVADAEVVTQRTRRMKSEILQVRIGDNAPAFYPQRLPEFEKVAGAVRPGGKVAAWVDVGKNNYIWQLEKGGEKVVSYDQVAESQKSNDSGNAMMGGLFLLVGLGVLGKAIMDWRTGKAAPAGGGTPAT
jgi:hypothetical protein